MTPRRLLPVFAFCLAALSAQGGEAIAWQPWSDAVFAQAKREHKFVLLDLEAVWCHWCHVMDATTYADPGVAAQIGQHYLAVKVDQDARPDLASRYEDYGWPATVIYGPDGTEIVKKQGYLPPKAMIRLLQAVVADPSPIDYREFPADAPAAAATVLPPERRAALHKQWLDGYDAKAGGWGFSHKYLDWDNVELAMREAGGEESSAVRARTTLRLQRNLLDPVWGGIYQYSVGGDWNEPHFEKIMATQAGNLRIYALAYAKWREPAYLKIAQAVERYLRDFLRSPSGAFYTSQDADLAMGTPGAEYFALGDQARRARGMPRIDTHVYARENGWAIEALADFAAVTDGVSAENEAETAADWIVAHRSLPGGGFRHDERDAAGPYLGDTLAMGRAFLALYQLTADSAWLQRAAAAATFIQGHFTRAGGEPGFASEDTTHASFPTPLPEFDENVALARFATALANATGDADFRAMASSALRWLLAPGMAERRSFYVAGLLLAEEEARTDPLHIAIIGGKDDAAARDLFRAALRAPTEHKLVEWWDRRQGPAPRGEDIYPDLGRPAAFLCDHGACSTPLFTASALAGLEK